MNLMRIFGMVAWTILCIGVFSPMEGTNVLLFFMASISGNFFISYVSELLEKED